MSESGRSLQDRLLSHLLDAEDEEQWRKIELEALEDDSFFDQLRAAEAELLDRYVQGDLDEHQSLRLAELIGRSQRLQESAETTLALHVRESGLLANTASAPAAGPPSETRRPPWQAPNQRLWGLLLVVLLLAAWMVVSMQRNLREVRVQIESLQRSQQSLESEVQLLEREIERLQEEQLRLQRRWAEEGSEPK